MATRRDGTEICDAVPVRWQPRRWPSVYSRQLAAVLLTRAPRRARLSGPTATPTACSPEEASAARPTLMPAHGRLSRRTPTAVTTTNDNDDEDVCGRMAATNRFELAAD